MQRNDVQPRAEVLARGRATGCKREHGITMLGGLGFENAYALAMRASAPRRSACARSPILRATRRSWRSPATTSSSAGRNGRRSAQRLRPRVPRAAPDAGGIHVSGGGGRRGRRDRRPIPATGASRSTTSSCSTIRSRRSRPTTRSCWCRRKRAGRRALARGAARRSSARIDVELMREANLRADRQRRTRAEDVARWLRDEIADVGSRSADPGQATNRCASRLASAHVS